MPTGGDSRTTSAAKE